MPTAWIHWDPSPNAFTIPYINHPVKWYGVLFAIGFFVSYWLFSRMLRQAFPQVKEETRNFLIERLTWFIMVGTVVGARLGHVFFYDFPYYLSHPIEIFKVWEGGLASHGGVIGILLSVYAFQRFYKSKIPELSFLSLLDMLAPLAVLTGAFIRLGNFINQEIIGTPSTLPWAVQFGHPAEGGLLTTRHPVQLYELLAYLFTFSVVFYLWKKKHHFLPAGSFTALIFIMAFTFRMILEFFKATQASALLPGTYLQAGQILSIPCIIGGIILLLSLNYKRT